jgi:hypothetical protein
MSPTEPHTPTIYRTADRDLLDSMAAELWQVLSPCLLGFTFSVAESKSSSIPSPILTTVCPLPRTRNIHPAPWAYRLGQVNALQSPSTWPNTTAFSKQASARALAWDPGPKFPESRIDGFAKTAISHIGSTPSPPEL